jgi:hypothetical protein
MNPNRWSIIALTVLACSTSSLAQQAAPVGSNVTGSFWAEDVQRAQGKLEIDPASHTILRFYDEVSFAFSRRSDLLKAVSRGTDVVLYVVSEKAEPIDLSVQVNNAWHFFTVKISKNTGIRYYEIKPKESPAQPETKPSSATPPTTATPTSGNSVTTPATPVSAPLETTATTAGYSFNLLNLNTFNDEWRVSYALENKTGERVIADDSRLEVWRGSQRLEFSVERAGGKSILYPGDLQSGLLRIKATPGAVRIVWKLRTLGSSALVTVEAVMK